MTTAADPVANAVEHNTALPGIAGRVARAYLWLAYKPALACAAVFLLTIGLRVALLPWLHVPKPAVHDEFSYLLAADTYASGRLTNPPHRFWEHFETFHVLQQPTYASKYQPMPGLFLAFGEKLFGQPWAGVLVSAALMCAAVCWMLQGWISPGAALLGGLLLMLRVGVLTYWVNSYWGGAVPALAIALAIGAMPRIARRRQFLHSITFAAGLAILMNSRPYESAVLALAGVAALAWWLWKEGVAAGVALRRVALPALVVLAITAGAMAYNNYRVTGNALSLPYQVHDQQYDMVSMFAWGKMRPEPAYHHAVMRKFWGGWHVEQVKTAQGAMMEAFLLKTWGVYDFFFGLWPLLVPPLIWPYRLKTTEERLTLFFLIVFALALAPLTGFAPHYGAAFACLAYLRFLQTLTRLRGWQPAGKPLGFAVAVCFVVLIPYQFGDELVRLFRNGEFVPKFAIMRDSVLAQLARESGRHLVLVRYSADHYVHDEWVYNRADIDASRIVWAREMTQAEDRPFIDYYRGRKIWLLEADQSPPKLVPYPEGLKILPQTADLSKKRSNLAMIPVQQPCVPAQSARTKSFGEGYQPTLVDRFGVWLSARQIRRYVPDFRGKRIGDFGCGFHAAFARTVLHQVEEAVLADVSLSAELCSHPKVRALQGPLPDVLRALEPGSLDVSLCISVLEHLWEPERALAEFHRLLAPGGVCLINVPSWRGKWFLEYSAFRLGLSPADEMNDHKCYYDPKNLWPLLIRAGFRPQDIRCFRHKFGLNTFAVLRVAK